jgi:two-component system, sensor histidine kinase and response regulator
MSVQNAYEVYCARRDLYLKNQEIQKINEELNRFVYSASHDLKAPLMSIKGLLYVARLEGNTKNPDKYFSMITDSVNQLEVFIGNIIGYYKNQRAESQYALIDFTKIICETIENYECHYHSSKINYNLDIDDHEEFLNDEFRIRIIINNLLSNAIKYQEAEEPNKTISISVKVLNGLATIIIEDNGIGIEEQYINNIYNMFYRATRENSGSGIGLYIVNEAVKKIDGEISVFSTLGVGTKFIISIPSKALNKI